MGNILYTQSSWDDVKVGGGTSGYLGNIRHRGAKFKANEGIWSVHIMQLFETMVDVVSQGSVRRENFPLTFLLSIAI